MNGNDWTKRYPRIVEEAARLREPLIIDAEVVHLSTDGVADFNALHSRAVDEKAVALAFDLLLSGDDIRRQPLIERKRALQWVLRKSREGIQYVEHTAGDGAEMFKAVCKLGLEGIGFKEADLALSFRTVEKLDQSQKSKGTRCNASCRWDVLTGGHGGLWEIYLKSLSASPVMQVRFEYPPSFLKPRPSRRGFFIWI